MEATRVLGGRYVLQDQLGAGGMAVVWRARDEVLGREVAIKLLAARHAGDPESRRRIRAEAQAAAALSHPNIAQVYDYGESTDFGVCMPYVVMELVRGGTLQQRMSAGPLPPRFAMRVAAEVAAALAAAHADGLVHRDIKPANVMVTPDGAKVVDFGIAAAVGPASPGEPDFEVLGTPAYLAPERLTDDSVAPASDVYALGVLLYRLLSGHSPWSADTTTQMLTAHVYIDPEPLAPLPEVPGYIIALCNRCLAKDMTERPSAREAAALLAQGAGLRVVEDAPVAMTAAPWLDEEPSVLIRRQTGSRSVPAAVRSAVAVPMPADTSELAPADPPEPSGGRRRLLPAAAVLLLVAAVAAAWWLLADDQGDRGTARAAPAVSRSAVEELPSAAGTPTPSGTEGVPVEQARPGATATTGRAPAQNGDRLTGTPTTGATPATTSPDPTATTTAAAEPDPEEHTLTSSAGSVVATCPTDSTAELLSWEATSPYKVKKVEPGPAKKTSVVFKHGNVRVKMTVTCSGGVPSSTEEEI